MPHFNYYSNLSELNDDKDNVFIISKGINTDKELFGVLYLTLKLPDYFGSNWDALNEVIGDREILPDVMHIVHLDLPLSDDVENVSIYLDILNDAANYLSTNPEPYQTSRGLVDRQIDFQVWFPKDLEEKVEGLLRVKQQS